MSGHHPSAHELLELNNLWASRQDPEVLKGIAEKSQTPKVLTSSITSRVDINVLIP